MTDSQTSQSDEFTDTHATPAEINFILVEEDEIESMRIRNSES